MDARADDAPDLKSLKGVVDRMAQAGDGDDVSVDDILAAFGQRSFGPLLVAPSLIIVSPLSSIPGLPSVVALIIAIVAVQMLLGRETLWLPRFLSRQRITRRRLERAAGFLRRIAVVIDRMTDQRLLFLTEGLFARLIAALCLLVAITMPPLEFLPMANTLTGAVISILGLSLLARDGLLALVAVLLIGIGLYFAITTIAPG